MAVKGFVKIIKRIGKEITQVIEQENLVVRNFYVDLLDWRYGGVAQSDIFISSNNTIPDFNIAPGDTLPDMVIADTPDPSWIDSVIPPFLQYQAQYLPPGFQRTIETVGLVSGANIHAYLVLDTPCIQEANEFLDVFYRLQFTNTGNTVFDHTVYDFAQNAGLTDGTTILSNWVSAYYFGAIDNSVINDYKKPFFLRGNLLDANPTTASGSFGSWDDGIVVDSHLKFKMIANIEAFENIGSIIKQIIIGQHFTKFYGYFLDKTNNPQPIQSFFGHSSSGSKPFFDSLTVQAGQGIINLSGTWTGGFPDFYRINITTGGDTGTAQYKIRKRKWLGFNGNTYEDVIVPCPFLNPYEPAVESFHGWQRENNEKFSFEGTKLVQYDQTGITIIDLLDGTYQNFDSTTTPALNASQIRQCAVGNGKIYAACRATGLYEIDPTLNTVTTLFGGSCYGVDVGRNNIVFAIAPAGIRTSADNYATAKALNVANKGDCLYIKVDPSHPNDRAAVIAQTNATDRIVKWWQGSDESTIDGYEWSDVPPFPAGFDVNENGTIWLMGFYIIDFGNVFGSSFSSNYVLTIQTVDSALYGPSTTMFQVQFYDNLIVGVDGLYNAIGDIVVSYVDFPNEASAYSVLMDGGIVFTEYGARQLFTDNNYCWIDYGWNGTAWVEGNPNSKTTHTNNQSLIDGIIISFTNNSNPNWVAGDYYTFAAADALVKDNATTLYLEHNWYSAPATFSSINQVIPGGLEITIPEASDPDYITLEVDSPKTHRLFINGTPVTLVRNDNTAPAPNEITIYADGRIVFNASDSGKTFSGDYLYVRI